MTTPAPAPGAARPAAPRAVLLAAGPDAPLPLRSGPDGAPADGAAAFLATLAEYEGCPVERLE